MSDPAAMWSGGWCNVCSSVQDMQCAVVIKFDSHSFIFLFKLDDPYTRCNSSLSAVFQSCASRQRCVIARRRGE